MSDVDFTPEEKRAFRRISALWPAISEIVDLSDYEKGHFASAISDLQSHLIARAFWRAQRAKKEGAKP